MSVRDMLGPKKRSAFRLRRREEKGKEVETGGKADEVGNNGNMSARFLQRRNTTARRKIV
jgi:hypothetical protein